MVCWDNCPASQIYAAISSGRIRQKSLYLLCQYVVVLNFILFELSPAVRAKRAGQPLDPDRCETDFAACCTGYFIHNIPPAITTQII
jgi:hypothetical protein